MSNYACPPCPSCDDSRLSTTANIIGIITFVYLLVIGIFYRVRAVKIAGDDVFDMYDDTYDLQFKPREWRERFEALPVCRLDTLVNGLNLYLDAEAAITDAIFVCEDLTKHFEKYSAPLWFDSDVIFLQLTLGVLSMVRYDETKRLNEKAIRCAAKVEHLLDRPYERCLRCEFYWRSNVCHGKSCTTNGPCYKTSCRRSDTDR
jgi:hypothetical protein